VLRGKEGTATSTNTKSPFFPTSKKTVQWGEGTDICFLLIFIMLLVTGGVETNLDPTGETLRKSKQNHTETREATIKKSAIWDRQPEIWEKKMKKINETMKTVIRGVKANGRNGKAENKRIK
jgi:hypothetical protein